MLSRHNSSSSFSIALKSELLRSKSENPAHYQTLIGRKARSNQKDTEFVIYPTFSIIDNVSETPINIPVINIKCPETCLFDLEHLISYLEIRAYVKKLQEEYHCPKCQQMIKASDYLIDYGYEYILRSYRRKLELKNVCEQANKQSVSPYQQESNANQAALPKGFIRINNQGDYTFIQDESAKSHSIDSISQLIDQFQTAKITKFTNSLNISEESKYDGINNSLRLKRDYLLNFTKKLEAVTKPKISRLKRPFCFARLSAHPDRQIEVSLVTNKIYLWFPSLKKEEKEFSLIVDLLKETDNFDNLDYCGLSYFIKIPEVGLWLTGGMSYKMNSARGTTNECYEIALRNISSLGKIRCQKKPSLPIGIIGHAGICVGDYLYVVGGSDGKNALTTAFRIAWRNPEKEGWVKLANMRYDKFYHSLGCTLDEKKIISVGGYFNYGIHFKSSSEIEQYEINLDKWTVLKLKAESDLISPTAYPFILPINNSEFFIWGGVDGTLGTSIMIHYKLNIETSEARKDNQGIKTLQKAISDFIDLNAIWDKEETRFLFLGPYRSERSKFSITQYKLNYDNFQNNTERKLLNDLQKKPQSATEENSSNVLESIVKSRTTSYAYK